MIAYDCHFNGNYDWLFMIASLERSLMTALHTKNRHFYLNVNLGKPSKKKKSESLDIVPTGGGSHRRGGMSQPTYLVTFFGEAKLCLGAEIIVFFKKIQIFFQLMKYYSLKMKRNSIIG